MRFLGLERRISVNRHSGHVGMARRFRFRFSLIFIRMFPMLAFSGLRFHPRYF